MKDHSLIVLACLLTLAACGKGGTKSGKSSIDPSIKLDPYKDFYNPQGEHDERIFNTLPKNIDLSKMMTPVRWQNDRGSCSFFAAVGLLESLIKATFGLELNLSEEHMNSEVKGGAGLIPRARRQILIIIYSILRPSN